jgi:hypothetical protein
MPLPKIPAVAGWKYFVHVVESGADARRVGRFVRCGERVPREFA